MGWIDLKDKYPPQGLQVLLEVSGRCINEHGTILIADHGFHIGSWLVPVGKKEGCWLIESTDELYDVTVHAWMPLPEHFEHQEIFGEPEDDLMEHAQFEDDPEWLYKGKYTYEQMSMEDFMKG